MKFDVFFSISQVPVEGRLPNEREMLQNFLDQVKAADDLGYKIAWVAEAHLSSQVQKKNPNPVIPHWEGEVGLNTDIFLLSEQVFSKTRRIETGSAVMNLLSNGGPIAAAERVAAFLSWHGLNTDETRKLNLGFAAGRFDFMNRAYGIVPKEEWEAQVWMNVRGKIFEEAAEIFLRLLKGEALKSGDVPPRYLREEDFRNPKDWEALSKKYSPSFQGIGGKGFEVQKRFNFESVKIIPEDWNRELLELYIGSHDPRVHKIVNEIYPTKVFNLSITQKDVIENTHERMQKEFHPKGGSWKREYMPRTTFVFINEEKHLNPKARSIQAKKEAHQALAHYWKALEGTIDPLKIEKAADNALVGNAEEITTQMRERFNSDDRLMLWFDFFNHDSNRVIRNMQAFMEKVAPHFTNEMRNEKLK